MNFRKLVYQVVIAIVYLLGIAVAVMVSLWPSIRHPEMTELQLWFEYWPYYLIVISLIFAVAFIVDRRV